MCKTFDDKDFCYEYYNGRFDSQYEILYALRFPERYDTFTMDDGVDFKYKMWCLGHNLAQAAWMEIIRREAVAIWDKEDQQ